MNPGLFGIIFKLVLQEDNIKISFSLCIATLHHLELFLFF